MNGRQKWHFSFHKMEYTAKNHTDGVSTWCQHAATERSPAEAELGSTKPDRGATDRLGSTDQQSGLCASVAWCVMLLLQRAVPRTHAGPIRCHVAPASLARDENRTITPHWSTTCRRCTSLWAAARNFSNTPIDIRVLLLVR